MSRWRELREWLGDRPASAWILGALALQISIEIALWLSGMLAGGLPQGLGWFRHTGTIFVVATAVAEVIAAAFVFLHFEPGEPLRPAWLFLLLAGCTRLAGVLVASGLEHPVRELGLFLGGPLQMALLGLGLAFALRLYKRIGLTGQLGRFDRFTFLVGVLFTVQVSLTWPAWSSMPSADPGLINRINWSSGPLLSLLLFESLLLRRSATRLHGGLIAECWSAYAAATFLSILADVGGWAALQGHLPAAAAALLKLLAFPAAAAYALGPALQVTAILRVRRRCGIRSVAINVTP